MEHDELNLFTDGKHHGSYLRINHYVLRDESYYRTYRLASVLRSGIEANKRLLEEHYTSFSLIKDFSVGKYIKKNFPEKYKQFWEPQQ